MPVPIPGLVRKHTPQSFTRLEDCPQMVDSTFAESLLGLLTHPRAPATLEISPQGCSNLFREDLVPDGTCLNGEGVRINKEETLGSCFPACFGHCRFFNVAL